MAELEDLEVGLDEKRLNFPFEGRGGVVEELECSHTDCVLGFALVKCTDVEGDLAKRLVSSHTLWNLAFGGSKSVISSAVTCDKPKL